MNLLQKPPVATVLSGHTDSIAEASRTLDTLTVAWRVLGVGKTVAEVAESHLCTAADIRLALRSLGVAALAAAFEPDAAPLPLEQQ